MTDGKQGELGTGRWAATYQWWIGSDTTWEAGLPHLRPPATDALEAHLQSGMTVLEWGAGASTIWLARLNLIVISLEMDAEWYRQVQRRLELEGLLYRVRLLYFGPQTSREKQLQEQADYILMQDDAKFDFILVDGRNRARCLAHAQPKVKAGGLICLDDSQRPEYAAGVALYRDWPRRDWGDEGWLTTIWTRPATWLPPREPVVLPNAEA
jgi:hypothetical protein